MGQHGSYWQKLGYAAEELAGRVWRDGRKIDLGRQLAGINEIRAAKEGEDEEGVERYARNLFGRTRGEELFMEHFAKGSLIR